jgi:hypothetical protein
MRNPRLLRFCVWMVVAGAWTCAGAQDATVPAGAGLAAASRATTPAPAAVVNTVPPPRRQRDLNVRFSREKAVLGLPPGSSKSKAHCSVDGTAFYDISTEFAGNDLYSISQDGGVKHLLRKLPIDFTNVWVRDFFAGDHQLVSLLQADKRDDGSQASRPRETDYFLALEDEAGDLSDLVQMETRFRPVKVARFGSGQVVALGWDEGNQLPVLAYVNEDGTVRRFVDFEERKREGESDAKAAAAEEKVTLDVLQGASFVPFGSEVMLTYPGTRKPVRILNSYAEPRTVPITIPAGYVLNDVLATDSRWNIVLRVREMDETKKAASGGDKDQPKMRLYEVESTHGSLIRELIPDKVAVTDMTCAPQSKLTAVFYDVLPDASGAAVVDTVMRGAATQLVVATGYR